MEFLFIVGPLVLVVGVIALIVVLVKRYERKRTEQLGELAAEMSLEFSAEGDAALEAALSDLALMQRGHSRRLTNLIRGRTRSVDLCLFDYRYTTGSGKHQSTHNLSVVAFDSPLLELPPFELGPENFLHRIAGVFGYQDIDFAGYPAFNKAFLLRGPDEGAIRQVFTEPVVQHFEHQLEHRRPVGDVIGHGHRLIVSTRRQKPEQLRAFLEQAFGIYGILKSAGPNDVDPVLTESADQG